MEVLPKPICAIAVNPVLLVHSYSQDKNFVDDKEKCKIKLIARVPLGKHFRNLEKKYEDKQNDQTRSILNSKQDYVTRFKRKSK